MNRSQQNQALKDLEEMVSIILEFENDAKHIIMRNRFSTGQRHHQRGELGEMEGTPGPHVGDPTGEEALWDERVDGIGNAISKMTTAMHEWLTMCRWMRDFAKVDVEARAKRTVPDCLACGDPCVGRVLSGFDEKCYRRWVRGGRPDRTTFINLTKNAKQAAEDVSND